MMARSGQNLTLIAVLSAVLVLAIGGAFATAGLAAHWLAGTGLTVQVPQPGGAARDGQTRLEAVLAALRASPGVSAARALSEGEMADLLRPWLGRGGENVSLPLPGIIKVQLGDPAADLAAVTRQLADIAPGAVVEAPTQWRDPVQMAARRLRMAGLALAVLVGLAAIIGTVGAAVGQRSADGALLHALGAPDRVILARAPGRFGLACLAGFVGSALAVGALIGLYGLTAPLAGLAAWPDGLGPLSQLGQIAAPRWPAGLWIAVLAVPLLIAALDHGAARASLRRWVRRMR